MNITRKSIALASALVIGALALSGCDMGEKTAQDKSLDDIKTSASARTPYVPKNEVEYNNYNKAQELYDTPTSIIWCTTTWGNASAPLVTVPVTGKLTSSSTSFFPNTKLHSDANGKALVEQPSVDGMYHGNPPGYRYGFTPGGVYVDFFNMPTFCTTALTEFQRQETTVSISNNDVTDSLQKQAEDALASGDAAGAQSLLEQIDTTPAAGN